MTPLFSFSPEAKQHIQEVLAQQVGARYLRVIMKRAGCSGWQYLPELVERPKLGDQRVMIEGLAVVVPKKQLKMIAGTQVQLVHKGLHQKQLVFQHPAATDHCGCGESFFWKDDEAGEAQ